VLQGILFIAILASETFYGRDTFLGLRKRTSGPSPIEEAEVKPAVAAVEKAEKEPVKGVA
jgi:hypothetical protein